MVNRSKFEENINLFLAGNTNFAESIINDCNPNCEYVKYLGRGNEALVLLAKNTIISRLEVFKIALPSQPVDVLQRFFRSVKILSSVERNESKNYRLPFPRTYTVSEFPAYISQEFINGVTLDQYIQNNKDWSLKGRIEFFVKLANGIDILHKNYIVHRDIKPQNIMVDVNGECIVLDFGLSKSVYENQYTYTGAFLGSKKYAAPEQIVDSATVDHLADIYALGKILFYLATNGSESFNTEELPVELFSVYPRATFTQKDRRHQSIGELLDDLCDVYEFLEKEEKVQSIAPANNVAKAFSETIILLGCQLGKMQKMLNVTDKEWEFLVAMAKKDLIKK